MATPRDLVREGLGLGLQRLQHLRRLVAHDVRALRQGLSYLDEDGAQALQTALEVLATWGGRNGGLLGNDIWLIHG